MQPNMQILTLYVAPIHLASASTFTSNEAHNLLMHCKQHKNTPLVSLGINVIANRRRTCCSVRHLVFNTVAIVQAKRRQRRCRFIVPFVFVFVCECRK